MARFGLPGISSKLPSDLKQFLDRVREWMTTRGENLVTRDELVNAGLITSDRTGAILPADPGAFSAIPPPAPENVIASGAMTNILVEWDAPRYGNHAYAEVWASGVDDLGAAAMVGTSAGTMFTHAVGAGETRYYWVRFVSRAELPGPYNAVAGTIGQTSSDPTWLLGVLEDQLTENQLHQDLSSRIDLIDGTGTGSVNLRIADEADARAQAILTEAAARQNGDSALQTQINLLSAASSGDLGELLAAVQEEQTARIAADAAEATSRETLATQMRGTYTGMDVAQITSGLVYSEKQARSTADSALATRASALEATVNSSTDGNAALKARIATEETTRATADTAEAAARTTLAARVTTAEGGITTNAAAIAAEQTARTTADSALTTSVNTISARLNSGGDVSNAIVQSQTTANTAVTNAAAAQTTANGKIKTYFQTTAPTSGMTSGDLWFDTDDSNKAYRYNGSSWADASDARITSTASQVTTLQTTVAGHTTSIQTQQSSIDGILGKYAVKIDNNGYVTGFGLISAANNGSPTSEFAIVADKFSIAPVATDPGGADGSPFFYLTTPTVINGVTVPAGAYIKSAYIADASITNAKIANAAVDNAKIVSLSADKLLAGSITADQYVQSSNYVGGSSGWRISGNGVAELSNAVVRGSVYANAGYIGGITVEGDAIRAGQSSFDVGNGFFLGADGSFSFGNGNTQRIRWDGTDLSIVSPELSLSNGSAFFSGTLNAATGTFAGALAAGVLNASAFDSYQYEFLTAGTFTFVVPAKKDGWSSVNMRLTMIGAGGGGAGGTGPGAAEGAWAIVNQNGSSVHHSFAGLPGNGGGAGAKIVYADIPVEPGKSLTVAVGAGGGGGLGHMVNFQTYTTSQATGANGGPTYVVYDSGAPWTVTAGEGGRCNVYGYTYAYQQASYYGFTRPTASSIGGSADTLATATTDSSGNTTFTSSRSGAGGSSERGMGGAAITCTSISSSRVGKNATGNGSGGSGGGIWTSYPLWSGYDLYEASWVGPGGEGSPGYVLVEFYDPNTIVLNGRYSKLIEWLDTLGHGNVPAVAR